MNRLAHRLVDIAARRWPADLATDLSREWHAEEGPVSRGENRVRGE